MELGEEKKMSALEACCSNSLRNDSDRHETREMGAPEIVGHTACVQLVQRRFGRVPLACSVASCRRRFCEGLCAHADVKSEEHTSRVAQRSMKFNTNNGNSIAQ